IPVDCPKASFAAFPIYTAGGSPRRRRGVLLAGNLRCLFPILWHGFHGDPIYRVAKQLIPSTRSVSRRQLGDGPLPLRYGSALPAGCLPQRSGAAPPTRQRGGCGCSILCSSINELATLSGAAGRRWRQVPAGRPRCDPEQVVLACSSPPPSCWCIWRTGNGMQSVSGQAASTGTRTAHESAPVTRGLCSC
ncbi:unnamed protein product, partial [Urochloa humidicola]